MTLSFWASFLRVYSLVTIEAVALAGVAAMFWFFRPAIRLPLRNLSANRQVLLTFVLALAAHAAVYPIVGTQAPGVHDEFSYLLMADTMASGRLVNPTHPLSIFFETFTLINCPATHQCIRLHKALCS